MPQKDTSTMAASNEIALELAPIIRVYKDGRIERLNADVHLPPSVDTATGVASKDVPIAAGVTARLYLPAVAAPSKLPVFVYYHGGCFCIGSAFSSIYHDFLNTIVSTASVIAVSVDYRLAPEHLIPAAYEDAWCALQWVASHAEGGPEPWLAKDRTDFTRLFLAGDSAGANIAHNVAMRVAAEGLGVGGARVESAVLLHPYFWGTARLPSEVGRVDHPFIPPHTVDSMWQLITGGADNDDPRLNPLAEGAPSLAGLGCRRVMVAVAEKDTLRDRGRAYFEALRKSGWGGEAQLWETQGEDHVFFLFKPGCNEVSLLVKRLVSFLKD
nr:PREDICTED: 2-hydroxyisoflavanone dehydratase-like [Musa acuminata subsp. malaccensis]